SAEKTIDIATPTRMIAVTSWARTLTSIVPTSGRSAPANAAAGSVNAPSSPVPTPSTVTSTTPKPAPEDTPSRYGSARGLRVTAWATAPAIASAAPTQAAVSARGRRDSTTIASRAPDHHGSHEPVHHDSGVIRCATIAHTSPSGIVTVPSDTDAPRDRKSVV